MISPVFTESFHLPPVCRREALRYAGARAETGQLSALLDEVSAEVTPVLHGSVCWRILPLSGENGLPEAYFSGIQSDTVQKKLSGCDYAVIFGATVGLPLDRLIARYGQIAPSKALMLQALGTERIEALCDVFCEKIRAEAQSNGFGTTPRFSPGYGDFPLDAQRQIFRILDCPRSIGLTLNESLLMSPSKSVTAIIGIGRCPRPEQTTGCSSCSKTDCIHRRMP